MAPSVSSCRTTVIEDRPAVEPDHVRHRVGAAVEAARPADAPEQAEQAELGGERHLVVSLPRRSGNLDPDNQAFAQGAKLLRQEGIHVLREDLELDKRRGSHARAARRGVLVIGHGAT